MISGQSCFVAQLGESLGAGECGALKRASDKQHRHSHSSHGAQG